MPTDRILIFDPTLRRIRKKNRWIAAYQSDRLCCLFHQTVWKHHYILAPVPMASRNAAQQVLGCLW
jgi:hypothetical protein